MVRTMVSEVTQEKQYVFTPAFSPLAMGFLRMLTVIVQLSGESVFAPSDSYPGRGNHQSTRGKLDSAATDDFDKHWLLAPSHVRIASIAECWVLALAVASSLAISKRIKLFICSRTATRKPIVARYSALEFEELEEDEEMASINEDDEGTEAHSPEPPSPPAPLNEVKLATRRIFTKNMLLVLLTALLHEMHISIISVAMPNMLVDPVSSREAEEMRALPFRFGGGAGFMPRSLAWFSTLFGIFGLPMQILLYPTLAQHFGTIKLWRIFYRGFPLLYFAYPYVAIMPSSTSPPSEKTGVAVWIYLVFIQASMSLLVSVVGPSQLVLTNLSSPHPSALARTHGISFFMSMAVRAISFTLAGHLYAYGSTHNMTGLVFWSSGVVSLCGLLLTPFVKEGDGHEIKLASDDN
ncbi:putative Major facilitator superfamily transporter [Seiridium cardinale]